MFKVVAKEEGDLFDDVAARRDAGEASSPAPPGPEVE